MIITLFSASVKRSLWGSQHLQWLSCWNAIYIFHSSDFSVMCAICVTPSFPSFISTVLLSLLHLQAVYFMPPLTVSVKFCLASFHHVSAYFLLSIHILWPFSCLPHVASCVFCVWAPISGPPVLWARWSRLLWETLWHGEGIKDWPDVSRAWSTS